MRFKENIDEVRNRIYSFWEGEYTGRALVAVSAPKTPGDYISMFDTGRDFGEDIEEMRKNWEDPETIYHNNMSRLERTYFAGESLPVIFQNNGTSGHCTYYGSVPNYGNTTIWFDPILNNLNEENLVFNPDVVENQLKITRYLAERAKDNYFVGMPDNCGTIDAIAHLYDSTNVLMDMIMNKDALKNAITKINDGWKIAQEKFYQATKEANNGGAHSWMNLLAPGRVCQMQCDLSVMISEQMYEEFVLPELEQQMEWIEYPVYHFDGAEQINHLDHILSLDKLRAIQWTDVAGQPSVGNYIDTLKKMQNAGKKLILMTPKEDIKVLLDNLSANGVYLHVHAKTVEEADEIVSMVEKYSKEKV